MFMRQLLINATVGPAFPCQFLDYGLIEKNSPLPISKGSIPQFGLFTPTLGPNGLMYGNYASTCIASCVYVYDEYVHVNV